MGEADLQRDGVFLWHGAICELPERGRDRRTGCCRVRPELPAPSREQSEIRPRQLLPHEPEHPPALLTLINTSRCCGAEAAEVCLRRTSADRRWPPAPHS